MATREERPTKTLASILGESSPSLTATRRPSRRRGATGNSNGRLLKQSSEEYDQAGNYIPLALRGHRSACDVCGGAGFVVPDVPISDPRFGRSVVCPACDGGEVLAAQRARQRAAILDTLARAGITESREHAWIMWDDWTEEALGAFYAEKALAVAVMRDWADGKLLNYDHYGDTFSRQAPTTYRFEDTASAWLHGAVGTGKTALAYLAYKTRLSRSGETGVFIEWTDLYDAIRASYGTRSEEIDQAHELVRAVSAVPVLLLDDVGQQRRWGRMADDEYEKLWMILNHRYISRLPTLLTSNLDYEALLDQTDDKLVSRLGQRYVIVPVGGQNLRTVR